MGKRLKQTFFQRRHKKITKLFQYLLPNTLPITMSICVCVCVCVVLRFELSIMLETGKQGTEENPRFSQQ
jgi:uncharacterized protein YggT (Ycf19 family)